MSRRAITLVLAAVLALVPGALLPTPAPRFAASVRVPRWLDPFGPLASHLEWIRFQRARTRGFQAEALRHAGRAIFWAPEETAGWELLAAHLGLYLASPEREADPDRRLAWFEAGLEVTRRGAERAARPADLALLRAALYLTKAEQDPTIWPAGADDLLERATEALTEAAELDPELVAPGRRAQASGDS